jgi:ATP-binding cassette subfamily B protein
VGATGVGKSELLERIAQILILQKKNISFTFQDPYIFNDSIKSNIFLGKDPSETDIIRAKKYLKVFGLDYVESDLDKLLTLEVGENGKRLSGGQAKRLQLVRSLVSEAEYVIWDDPFSSIDLILEKEILTLLKNDEYLKSKTFILSSHRLSTVKYADQLIYLNKEVGIVESGNISALLQPGTSVYEYFKLQMV